MNYNHNKIPDDLDDLIKKSKSKAKSKKLWNKIKISLVSSSFIIFIFLLNFNSTIAIAMCNLPNIGQFFKVFSFTNIYESNYGYIKINRPDFSEIQEKEFQELIQTINVDIDQLILDSKNDIQEYYAAFVETGGNKDDFYQVDLIIDYQIYCNNQDYLSFKIEKYDTALASSYLAYYYNYNKNTHKLDSLHDILGVDYKNIIIDKIQTYIDQDPDLYFDVDLAKLINYDRQFYIDQENNLVICFNKYEIAPGSAGKQEFKINLVNN